MHPSATARDDREAIGNRIQEGGGGHVSPKNSECATPLKDVGEGGIGPGHEAWQHQASTHEYAHNLVEQDGGGIQEGWESLPAQWTSRVSTTPL